MANESLPSFAVAVPKPYLERMGDNLDNQLLSLTRLDDLIDTLSQKLSPSPTANGVCGDTQSKPPVTLAYLSDFSGDNADYACRLANRLEDILNRL